MSGAAPSGRATVAASSNRIGGRSCDSLVHDSLLFFVECGRPRWIQSNCSQATAPKQLLPSNCSQATAPKQRLSPCRVHTHDTHPAPIVNDWAPNVQSRSPRSTCDRSLCYWSIRYRPPSVSAVDPFWIGMPFRSRPFAGGGSLSAGSLLDLRFVCTGADRVRASRSPADCVPATLFPVIPFRATRARAPDIRARTPLARKTSTIQRKREGARCPFPSSVAYLPLSR